MSFKNFTKYIGKYIGIFIIGVLLICVYKTFDNFTNIISFFNLLKEILMPFFIGFAIAFILYKPCCLFEKLYKKTKLKYIQTHVRGISILSVYLSLIILFIIIIQLLIPSIISSFKEFSVQLPSIAESLISYINSFDGINFDPNIVWDFFSFDKIVTFFDLTNVDKYVAGVKGISSVFINGFMAIAISVYILSDRTNLKHISRRIVHIYIPDSKIELIKRYLVKITEYIYKYIYCQLLDACVIFAISFVILLCFRVPYAPVMALILGISNMIPYFGAIIGSVLIVLIVLVTNGLGQAAIIGVTLLVLQQIDANVIQPKLVSDSLSVKPLWVILGILIGGAFFGILGIFLAVPVMAVLKIIVLDILDYHEQRSLERDS